MSKPVVYEESPLNGPVRIIKTADEKQENTNRPAAEATTTQRA
jgi:hypothetical protein